METVLALVEQYRSLNLSQAVDYDKFNHYAITKRCNSSFPRQKTSGRSLPISFGKSMHWF